MNVAMQVSHLDFPALVAREWLATNGIGGYACSTIPSLNTRKYHGLLVAAMSPPVRRMVLLSRVEETLTLEGRRYPLGCAEYPGAIHPQGHHYLRAFNCDPFPRWAYQTQAGTVEKSLRLLRGENTVILTYTLLTGGKSIGMELRPLLALRPIHELMQQWNGRLLLEARGEQQHRLAATSRTPEVFMAHTGVCQTAPDWYLNHVYRREIERGYASMEDLWSPGLTRFTLPPGQPMHFVCSTDPIDLERVLERADWQCSTRECVIVPSEVGPTRRIAPPSADPTFDALVTAAGQFPVAGPPDGAGERASDKSVICIGAYPWGAPSVRASLIGFTGLLLIPGRLGDARALLLSLAERVRHGLLPAYLPEDGGAIAWGSADVSLWWINAVFNYFRYTCDVATLRRKLLDVAIGIIDAFRRGDDAAVRVDSEGLLAVESSDGPATWMDAMVGDWVLTPRNGRAVEINALWFNAVCAAAELSERYGSTERAAELALFGRRIEDAFNRRFWNEAEGCCHDVVADDATDSSVRPNQLLAVSLPFPVLSLGRHARVLEKVKEQLLTPRGIRTLWPRDPHYVGRYEGNVVSRDKAHFNGSAHPWLLGPYVTALLRVRGRGAAARDEARAAFAGVFDYLMEEGIGQVCELFDGDAPHRPGGAPVSALSISELLRAYTEDLLDLGPAMPAAALVAPVNLPAPHDPPVIENRA